MTTIKTTVWNRRIDVPAPSDIPDGTEVTLSVAESDDQAPLPQAEISRVLAAMQKLDSWNIPADIASALDDWEQQINQRDIEHHDPSAKDVFR